MAEPRTILIPGDGTRTQSYRLPPGVLQFVEAVKVEITNGSANDVSPVLSISEQTGVVIAGQEQGRTIPAGGQGRASWFLRGDDEGTGGATTTLVYALIRRNVGTLSVANNTLTTCTFDTATFDTDGMWSALAPDRLTVQTDGIYLVNTVVFWAPIAGTNFIEVDIGFNGGFSQGLDSRWSNSSITVEHSTTAVHTYSAGDYIRTQVLQLSVGARSLTGPVMSAIRIGDLP